MPLLARPQPRQGIILEALGPKALYPVALQPILWDIITMPEVRLTVLRAQPAELVILVFQMFLPSHFFILHCPERWGKTHQTVQLLPNIAALHRNKLLIVHSKILIGKKIIVWGWSVVLTTIKNICYTPCNKFCPILRPYTPNFPSSSEIFCEARFGTYSQLLAGE